MNKKNKMPFSLTELELQNFKCFESNQTISFKKLTVLTGANSSGKSSVLHAVLGALQSDNFPLKFSTNGKYFNMGDFTQISNKHTAKEITLGFTFKHSKDTSIYKLKTIWIKNEINHLPEFKFISLSSEYFRLILRKESLDYSMDFSYNPIKDPDYSPENEKKYIADQLRRFISRDIKSDNTKKDNNYEKELSDFKKMIATTFKKVSFKNYKIINPDNLIHEIRKKKNIRLEFMIDIFFADMCKDYDEYINSISSFRLHPDRTYLEQSRNNWKIEKFGEGYLDQILLWEKTNKGKINELQIIMKEMSLTETISSHRIEGGRYEVQVTTKNKGIKTSLFDVGFGISQFLPIIVADLQLEDNSTLFIAEPEIHLHPNVQARFGDYLVTQINKKNKNYVIETHSEYLLNRIRLAIVKGTLKDSDLAIYYLENNGLDVKIHTLKFNKHGHIENAPKSFFDTYMMDLKEIAFSV